MKVAVIHNRATEKVINLFDNPIGQSTALPQFAKTSMH
jgi:hypothetical protein